MANVAAIKLLFKRTGANVDPRRREIIFFAPDVWTAPTSWFQGFLK